MSRLADAFVRARGADAAGPASDAAPAAPPSQPALFESAPPPVETGDAVAAAPPGVEAAATVGRLGVFHGFAPRIRHTLVTSPGIDAVTVEQYRRLAGTLHHVQLERGTKVLMIASAVVAEGKTLTATNLALTLSESYHRRVLLMDADLRRPTLHEVFQVPNAHGLGDALRAQAEERLSVIQVSPRLALLTAGRPDPDPVSGLTSLRMQRVIDEARTVFDWVIVDTPPVGLLTDARLLAAMTDATLLVVRAGSTRYGLAQQAVRALDSRRILGTVLNCVSPDVMRTFHAYDDYYYAGPPRAQVK